MAEDLYMDLGDNELLTGQLGQEWLKTLKLDERDHDDQEYRIIISGNLTGITESFTKAFAQASIDTLNGYAFGEIGYNEDKYELDHTLGDVSFEDAQFRGFCNFSHKIGYLQTKLVRELDKQKTTQPEI